MKGLIQERDHVRFHNGFVSILGMVIIMNILENICVTAINDIVIVPSECGRKFQMHNRPSYGISFAESGKIVYYHNNQTYLSNPNDVIFMPKGASYHLKGIEKGNFPLINFQCTSDFKADTFLTLPIKNSDCYIQKFRLMQHLLINKNNHLKIMGMFYEMLHQISSEQNRINNPIRHSVDYMNLHYCDSCISNKELADQTDISEVYFRKLFLKNFGISPKQYIIDMRIQKAKQMLIERKNSVTQISEECGFSSIYHFCRIFKEKTGLTPTEYSCFKL